MDDKVCFSPIEKHVKTMIACPICGKADATYIQRAKFYNELVSASEDKQAVLMGGCKRCDIEIKAYSFKFHDNSYKYLESKLVERWNTRNYKEEEK